jgi:hypothetical protein
MTGTSPWVSSEEVRESLNAENEPTSSCHVHHRCQNETQAKQEK